MYPQIVDVDGLWNQFFLTEVFRRYLVENKNTFIDALKKEGMPQNEACIQWKLKMTDTIDKIDQLSEDLLREKNNNKLTTTTLF